MTDSLAGQAAVRETHVSILFFVGDLVFKLKKPVRLDFLDFSTREQRERVCRRELELNRRLAPDVYLDVLDVVDSDGEPRDHLLLMRRMPDHRRLSLLATGDGADECIREVAHVVAAFHARCETSGEIAAQGEVERVRVNWESNFATMEPFVGTVLDPDVALNVQSLARRYLDGRAPLFDRRIAHGKVRDGHGDLLADDIFCLDDGPRILDCIEFDDHLRYGDVLADVAFLAMDLERVADLRVGTRFLDWYREFAAETYPQTLAEHYVAYRAHVRSKVACLRSAQGDDASIDAARQLLGMTYEHLRAGRVTLVLVGGLPGTGKSTVASGLSDTLGWTLLRSDELRKDLAGIGHTESAAAGYREGIYAPEATDATYHELLTRAQLLLASGEPTIIDASWAGAGWRERAMAIARDTSSELVELRCELDAAIAAQRLSERARAQDNVSDATAATAAQMAPDFAPWPSAVALGTIGDVPSIVASALDVVRQ
jgi:aminoglycoside phosphotransferase family enzyme/predicted kinase